MARLVTLHGSMRFVLVGRCEVSRDGGAKEEAGEEGCGVTVRRDVC